MATTNSNGQARPTIPASIDECKAQTALLTEQLTFIRLTREKKLFESLWGWWDSFGGSDLWDRIRPRTNDSDAGFIGVPPALPSDRRHGSKWPIWRTPQELDLYRQEARVRLEVNSYAGGLLRNRTNNVIGKGFAYQAELTPKIKKEVDKKKKKAEPKEPTTPSDQGFDDEEEQTPEEKLVEAVQAVIDRFLKANRWNGKVDPQTMTIAGSREREIYQAVVGDGEAFIRFHPSDKGLEIRMIDPSQVRDYSSLPQEGWSYGIQHKMEPYEDVETPVAYCVFWPDPSAAGGKEGEAGNETHELVDASEILHIKGPDTPSLVKRGISQFLFGTGRALDRAEKLQENTSVSGSIRAANAEIWQMQQQTQAQVDSMAAALASRQAVDPVTGANRNQERRYPGMIRRIPEGMEWVDVGAGQGEEYLAIKMGDLQAASASSCSPAFWLGDTENANYSNLESASAPAVRQGLCEQEYFKTAFATVIWRAVLFAVERGELPEDIEDIIEIHVEAPAVLHRNELEKAQQNQIAITTGWKDRQTVAEEEGLDWEVVQERNQEYIEETGGGMGEPLGDEPDDEQPRETSGRGRPAPK